MRWISKDFDNIILLLDQEEARKREEIMARGNAERLEKDKQRKLEIQRQEQLLSGRIARAKTEEVGDPSGRGPGIQIYHYKDPGALS